MMREGPFHLLHVFPSFGLGGVPIRICEVANRLGPAWRHSIYALDGECAATRRLEAGLTWTAKPLRLPRYGLPATLLAYRRLFRRERPDLLLTYNWGAVEAALANALWQPLPQIHFESGFGPEEAEGQLRRRVFLRRLALKRCRALVVPSSGLATLAESSWGLAAARVRLLRNGVDAARFRAPPGQVWPLAGEEAGPGRVTIGTLAPLRREKNLARLLQTFAALRARAEAEGLAAEDLRLVIAGDGGERAALEGLAADLGIAGATRFLGHRDDVPQVLAAFDLFALTSDTEQLPNSLLQAAAAGRPVVAVDVGDVAAALAPESRPFVTAKADREALVANLARLCRSADLRRRLGAANQVHVRRHHGMEAMVAAYRGLFLETLAAPRRGASRDVMPREIAPREIAPREMTPREVSPQEASR